MRPFVPSCILKASRDIGSISKEEQSQCLLGMVRMGCRIDITMGGGSQLNPGEPGGRSNPNGSSTVAAEVVDKGSREQGRPAHVSTPVLIPIPRTRRRERYLGVGAAAPRMCGIHRRGLDQAGAAQPHQQVGRPVHRRGQAMGEVLLA